MLFLTEADVRKLLPMEEAIALMQGAFERLASGEALEPAPPAAGPARRARRCTTWLRGDGRYFGAKIYSTNPRSGAHFTLLLYRAADAELLAVIQANWLGQIRTGAVSGVATRMHGPRPDADTVAVIGSGFQARSQLDAIAAVRRLRSVKVWSRSAEKRTLFAREASGQLGIPVEPAAGAEEAVRGAAIVVTMTNAREPVLEASWIGPGTHINAAGSNQPNRRELPAELVLRADLDRGGLHRAGAHGIRGPADGPGRSSVESAPRGRTGAGGFRRRLHPHAGRRNHSLQIQRLSCRRCGERRVCLRARHSGRGRAGSAAGSFLSGHLLFDIAPGADLQAAADPAQRFGGNVRRLRAANRALHGLIDSVRGKGTLRLFQDFRRYYRFRPRLHFPSHCQPPEYDISMLKYATSFSGATGASRSAPCYARRTKRRRVFGSPWRRPESRSTAGNAGPG